MGISTPPSASSSSATHLIPIPPQPQPGSPVKPVAERRPVKTATLCNSKRSVTVTNTLLINLNELPNPNPNSLQNASETSTALSRTLTYQRRHHHHQYPHMLKAKTEDGEDGNASNESSKQQQHDEPTRWCFLHLLPLLQHGWDRNGGLLRQLLTLLWTTLPRVDSTWSFH
ncbi:hypothetical protein Prudu_007548 [Prunus dulcis]|uniref:Uncharacterized protein n=1 Tax=Prunus dulcis TaxID=3755 RepID=A0A4Y1R277_PRUDU|nr:hypothetical protein Prudu_007548 [Prunus dulcis]